MGRKSGSRKNQKMPSNEPGEPGNPIMTEGPGVSVLGGGAKSKSSTTIIPGFFTRLLATANEYVGSLNNSKYFAGIVMIMLNLGGKVVSVNFSKSAQEYLKFNVGKQLFVFSMAWMGTRDIYTALVLTAVFVVLSEHLLNEESKFCIVPENLRVLKNMVDTNNDGVISDEELAAAVKVLEKAKGLAKNGKPQEVK